ncbi:ParB N-terminal domain-containing protein [Paraburkholderia sp. HD33-4]|uniref:ParB N-terminal domain-containing protein n=1 Tax=Paraburkholderia sp. HD33-4 TaxID=2883242 RepID=UPI001F3FB5E5|nr:ParB N-terminal domain-containing protein [Paraburkholderia sp. HD33-4]
MTPEKMPTTDNLVDVFTLPVHPFSAMFPMLDDERLDEMAERIKQNGLIYPVALGKVALVEGEPPVLCVIDGRNRIEACKRAGVTPDYIVLADDEDLDAYIADMNFERRSLSKGQRAMLIAVGYPEQRTYPGQKSESRKAIVSKSISSARVSQARAVLRYCSHYVDLVIAGSMGLDAAYEEATRLKAEAQDRDLRIEKLRAEAPDLAALVGETLTLAAAEEAVRERHRQAECTLRETVQLVDDMDALIARMSGEQALVIAKRYVTKRDHFNTPVPEAAALWIAALDRLKDALREGTQGDAS